MNRTQALDTAPLYFHTYINRVEEGDILEILRSQIKEVRDFFTAIPEEKWEYAYAEGKWTLKELLGHLIDTERVFGYRGLRFSRKDAIDIPGFDENLFVANGGFNERSSESLMEEFELCRRSNLLMLENLPEGGFELLGSANSLLSSVGAIAWILAGHPIHHIGVVKERYL